MEIRCQNCHARLSVPSAGALKEIQCPKCGVMMFLPLDTTVSHAKNETARKKHQTSLRRVFEPIPAPVTYGAGALLALLLLSPFVWYLFFEEAPRKTIFISDEPLTNARPAGRVESPPPPPIITTNTAPPVVLSEFAGVRLDSRRSDLDYRFNLVLLNTRGMQPEIYEGTRVGDIERIVTHFYGGLLKQFTITLRPRIISPEAVRIELTDLFGPPQLIEDVSEQPTGSGLGGVPGLNAARPELTFAFRRQLVWSDAKNRVVATIHYTPTEAGQNTTMLEVEVSAAAWLRAHNPLLGTVTTPVTNLAEQPPFRQETTRPPEPGRLSP